MSDNNDSKHDNEQFESARRLRNVEEVPRRLTNTDEALRYLAMGFCPVPVRTETKRPPKGFPLHTFFHRLPTEDEGVTWFHGLYSSAGIALVAGSHARLCFLDFDPRHWLVTNGMDMLVDAIGPLPEGPRVRTGGLGHHHYFLHPGPDVLLGTHLKLDGVEIPGVDLIAQRLYVVAPPSRHPSGLSYLWEASVFDTEVPPLPQAALELGLEAGKERHWSAVHRVGDGVGDPCSVDEQEHFADLWLDQGIILDYGDRKYVCPFHSDGHPSLCIHSERCVWWCFGCEIGGGFRALEERLGRPCRNFSAHPTSWPTTNADTVDLDGPDWCPNPRRKFRQRDGTTAGRIVPVPCHLRSCVYCGRRKRIQQATHYAQQLDKSGDTVYVATIRDGDMERFTTKVRRASKLYVCCPQAEDNMVFTTLGDHAALIDPYIITEGLEAAILDAAQSIPSHDGRKGRNISASQTIAPERASTGGYYDVPNYQHFQKVARDKEFQQEAKDHGVIVGSTDGEVREITMPEPNTL